MDGKIKMTTQETLENNIQFREDSGKIKFIYEEPAGDGGDYKIREIIPSKIVQRGERDIIKYALSKVNEARKEWKKIEDIRNSIKKNHIFLETQYGGGPFLEGRIVGATPSVIRVELDKPLSGKGEIFFGISSGWAGHHIFTDDYQISKEGYDGARRALCRAYEDALHKPEKDLVQRLNKIRNLR